MSSISSQRNSTLSLKVWGCRPMWLPVRLELAAGSMIQLMLTPTRCSSSRQHHGDLGGIDAVGAEHRAAAAFGALIGVHEPFLQHPEGHLPAAGHFAENFAGQGKVVPVYGAQQFGPENRHVFGIAGAQEEVALVGAGAATHTAVHEDLQGAEFVQPFLEPVEDDLLPVLRQLPVIICGIPVAWLTEQPGMAEKVFCVWYSRISFLPG